MKNKTLLGALIALCFSCLTAPLASGQIPKIGLDTSWKSNYVTPNGVAYGDPVVRADLTAAFKHGIGVGLTGITGFGGDSPYSEEWQIYAQKTWSVCTDVYAITGLRYEFIDGPWDLAIPYVEIGQKFEINDHNVVVGYGRAEYWYNPQETSSDNGLIATIGLKYLHMFSDKFSIRMGMSAVHDDGLQGGGAGFVGVGEAYLDYRVSAESTAYLGGKYYTPMGIENPADVRKSQKVFEVGVRIDDFPAQVGKLYHNLLGIPRAGAGTVSGGKLP